MQAIREIEHVHGGTLTLALPAFLDERDVEVIVLPVADAPVSTRKSVASLYGRLNDYANPARIQEEPAVWSASVEDSHDSR